MKTIPFSDNPASQADTVWVHLFRSMILNGDVARMGPYAFTVYSVIKAYIDLNTGWSGPGIDLIVEKSGVSKSEVYRSLEMLEQLDRLDRRRRGRRNEYRLKERIPICNGNGLVTAIASWDYVPTGTRAATNDLLKLLEGDERNGVHVVHVTNLQINVTQTGGNNVMVNKIEAASGAGEILDFLRTKFPR
ncbi:helix-turn-helix domain-containing protein [Burkholderia vietnamiensis]|uniref:helix-turn-helix domain-containing protein n=1 Tax=Burkholderia vietnamiensis TaxID=60552 RepID=UPI00158BB9CC|nr:helix-turn-helix domain-containing protein [Burkholderia vietnamiensis]